MLSFVHSKAKMKELYRLTSFIIRNGVASRHWARLCRFSNPTNSSRLIMTNCKQLLTRPQMSLQVNFFGSRTVSYNCDEPVDESLDADIHYAVKRSDSLEREPCHTHQTELDVSGIVPALPKKSFSLAPYVNDSKALRHLVMLGVDLSRIEERNISVAQQLVKLDFERDVEPVLLFLHHCDVKESDIGECITRNPLILCESIDDMQVRVNYLESKRFSKELIAKIVSKAPRVLTTPTKETDVQLGYLQQDFMLSGI